MHFVINIFFCFIYTSVDERVKCASYRFLRRCLFHMSDKWDAMDQFSCYFIFFLYTTKKMWSFISYTEFRFLYVTYFGNKLGNNLFILHFRQNFPFCWTDILLYYERGDVCLFFCWQHLSLFPAANFYFFITSAFMVCACVISVRTYLNTQVDSNASFNLFRLYFVN